MFLSKDGGVEKSGENTQVMCVCQSTSSDGCFSRGLGQCPQFSAFLPGERHQLTNLFPARLQNSPWEHQDPMASLSQVLVFVS